MPGLALRRPTLLSTGIDRELSPCLDDEVGRFICTNFGAESPLSELYHHATIIIKIARGRHRY